MDDQITLLRTSWARVEPRVPALLPAFAARVPGMRELSPRAAAEATDACAALVAALDDPRRLVRDVVTLARRHDVPAADYPALAEAFLHTLDGAAGAALTGQEREAWADAARLVCSIARRAAERGRAAPAVTAPSPPAPA